MPATLGTSRSDHPSHSHQASQASQAPHGTAPERPPRAQRASSPGWRDPRLWIGLLLVATSVVVGARLLAAADDTITVWAAAGDLGKGQPVTGDDLVATRVRFPDPAQLARYVRADQALPADPVLTRPVAAGELVPRSALGAASDRDTVSLPLAVDAARVPDSVRPGSLVDVYVVTPPQANPGPGLPAPPTDPVLTAATVVEAPPLDDTFAATGQRQLVLAVDDAAARAFFTVLASAPDAVTTVVGRR